MGDFVLEGKVSINRQLHLNIAFLHFSPAISHNNLAFDRANSFSDTLTQQ